VGNSGAGLKPPQRLYRAGKPFRNERPPDSAPQNFGDAASGNALIPTVCVINTVQATHAWGHPSTSAAAIAIS